MAFAIREGHFIPSAMKSYIIDRHVSARNRSKERQRFMMQLLKKKIGAETLMFGFGQAMFAEERRMTSARPGGTKAHFFA